MQTNTRKISTLIETQLPGFISSEYENFSKFVEKYYEHLENRGNTLDIIGNIEAYRDINFYEKNLLQQSTTLSGNISSSDTTITVSDASSFPEKNGYIKIGGEICFYKERTSTQFQGVSRGVSGNTTLGDLYTESTFVTTQAADHISGVEVYNISNLFLYALIKSFENQYLSGIPEKYLKGDIDKRNLIKNISQFYKAKGTSQSIKFIFNSIIAKEAGDVPEVYNPKDYTLKASVSDWQTSTSLKVKVLSGDATDLIGKQIVQALDPYNKDLVYASSYVENVISRGSVDGEEIYEIVLDSSSVNGTFEVASKTTLKSSLAASKTVGDRIDVYSTEGWKTTKGRVYINGEEIKFDNKNVNQFVIQERSAATTHASGSSVYSFSTVEGSGVKLLVLGVLYNLNVDNTSPYSEEGDVIQTSNPGFETTDRILYDQPNDRIRWFINTTVARPQVPTNQSIQDAIGDLVADVSAIYEDEQYYYICSSGFPSSRILSASTSLIPEDLKSLRLIRKQPITTTEVYETTSRDVGIFLDGTLAFGNKDSEYIDSGKIVKTTVLKSGSGYKLPPYVLINNNPNRARAVLAGETLESVEILTEDIYATTPTVTVTAGRNAAASAIVTNGRITSLVVDNPGEYYSSPPTVVITDLAGRGKFANYTAQISSDGKITGFEKVEEGKFYTAGNVRVTLVEDANGKEAQVTASLRRWYKDRYANLASNLDDNGGYVFETYESSSRADKDYGYGIVANPKRLRYRAGDNLNSTLNIQLPVSHSPILGYAYDGNPIYGPYGYSDPLDSGSYITKMNSGYIQNTSRPDGPSTATYPLGTFVDDYTWTANSFYGKTTLDQNNGRYCVTPEYPEGVYAYFLAVDQTNNPVFPYILGKNYYSLPVDSNYNSEISQDDLPRNAKRLFLPGSDKNGQGSFVQVRQVKGGSVSSVSVSSSHDTAYVGSSLIFDNAQTGGSSVTAKVSSVEGKSVTSVQALEDKVLDISTVRSVYMFDGDTITQANTNASGTLVGNSFNSTRIVLRNVSGTFNTTDNVTSSTVVKTLILEENGSFTKNANIILTDGINAPAATGEILEKIVNQNTLKVKVVSGSFTPSSTLFLKSDDLNDSTGIKISSVSSLSEDVDVASIKENVALVQTSEDHNLTIGDDVIMDILPSSAKTTTYYVRKRYFQKVTIKQQVLGAKIKTTGIGRSTLLCSGDNYFPDTYQDVPLTGGSGTGAEATVVVGPTGIVSGYTITKKGSGYKVDDILSCADLSLAKQVGAPPNTTSLKIRVDHVGVGSSDTVIDLDSVTGLSSGDVLTISKEDLLVASVDTTAKTITVTRGYNSTTPGNYFDGKEVNFKSTVYNFNVGSQFLGTGANDPYIRSYDASTQELILEFDYTSTSPNNLVLSNTFFDNSTPTKLVKLSSVGDVSYQFEFSKDNVNFDINPVIDVQKYYEYRFDCSHSSMSGVFFDLSPSITRGIIAPEAVRSITTPGQPGAGLTFIPQIKDGKKTPTRYLKYYYYDKKDNINTENSYLSVIDDPLQGFKNITYVTSDRFLYEYEKNPQYDGSGTISYTTTSNFAVGKINEITVENPGAEYKRIPVVTGYQVHPSKSASFEVIYDSLGQKIYGIKIISGGSGYSKPKVRISDGDGKGTEFKVVVVNGVITAINTVRGGSGFTYKPTIEIIETDNLLFAKSNNIGSPQSLTIVENGGAYHNDQTLQSQYTSHYALLVSPNNQETNAEEFNYFAQGQTVVQKINNAVVFSASVSKNGWRSGSNILRLEKAVGVLNPSIPIISPSGNSADISSVLYSTYTPDVKGVYDNLGKYTSDKGKLSARTQRITDSYFYQDYSYVIKSKTAINTWRDLIKETVHPAGFNVFGEVVSEVKGAVEMPTQQPSFNSITQINLAPKQITVIDTKRTITNSIVKLENLNLERGLGSVRVDTFDASETLVYELELTADFDGQLNTYSTGQRSGTRSFTLREKKSQTSYTPYNQNQLIVTLDGILQEPGVAFTVSGSQITFAEAPLVGQKFYCRTIRFKDNILNAKYFKKLKSLEFDGTSTEYELRYDDNSIVKTDVDENLFVTLNGVLQDAKSLYNNTYAPYGNAYEIVRSDDANTSDKIKFTHPPINHDDYYATNTFPLADQLAGAETSFLFSLGSYKRLKIDENLSPYVRTFLLKDENSGKVVGLTDPKYALVFVDGVLQVEGKSYTISGPNLTFKKPLNYYFNDNGEKTYQKVTVIMMFGRTIPNTLTFYDFEPNTYVNELNLTFTAVNPTNADSVYNQLVGFIGNNAENEIIIYKTDGGVQYPIGKYVNIRQTSNPDEIEIRLIGNNPIPLDSSDALYFRTADKYFPELTIFKSSGIGGPSQLLLKYSAATLSYILDSEGNRILVRRGPRRFIGTTWNDTHWYETARGYANLLQGDQIKIDGESEFRTIISTPYNAKSTEFRDGKVPSNDIYAQVDATDYNDITRGEGLSVQATITDGKVTKLDWNRRDLTLFFRNNILLQPTAYQYFTTPFLNFIPTNGAGGGAKAEVIVFGGQVIDVVLTDPGSGYTEAPRVEVSRGYYRVKHNRKADSVINLAIQSVKTGGFTMFAPGAEITFAGAGQAAGIDSIITFGNTFLDASVSREPTTIVEPSPKQVPVIEARAVSVRNRIQNVSPRIVSLSEVSTLINTNIAPTLETVEANSTFIDYPSTIEITSTVVDVINEPTDYIPVPSSSETGTFLDAPLNIGDNIIYIPNSDIFLSSGKLIVGGEVVAFYNKGFNTLRNVTRGLAGTEEKNHPAGTYLRTVPEFVSFASLAPELNVEVSVSTNTLQSVSVTSSTVYGGSISSVSTVQATTPGVEITENIIVTSPAQPLSTASQVSVVAGGLQLGSTFSAVTRVSSIETSKHAKIRLENEDLSRYIELFKIEKFYKTGILDGYQESVVFPNPITLRDGTEYYLVDRIVNLRDGSTFTPTNQQFGSSDFFLSYSQGNLGNTLGMYNTNAFTSGGSLDVGTMSIADLTTIYPRLTLGDFIDRANSAITKSRRIWNLGLPTTNELGATLGSNISDSDVTLSIASTTNFPATGTIMIGYEQITYTGKTATTLTGLTRGANGTTASSHTAGDYLRTFG